LVAVVFSLVGAWVATRPKASRVSALAIATTPATAVTVSGGDRAVGITPDGSRVLYVGNHGRDLFVRPMDATDPASVYRGTPRAPFASPDGLWVGFIDSNTTLKKIAMNGGPATTLATLDGGSRGAVWLPDDTIVLATAAAGTGLQQVSAGGGPVTVLTRPDREHGEGDHVWPEALPGGEAVLFTIVPATGGVDAAQIAVFDRKTKEKTVVLRGGSHARYVASGHLLFYAGGALRAVAFDARTRTTRGTPTPVVSEVVTTGAAPAGGVEAGVATDGTMIYVRGRPVSVQRGLVWVDREGRETPLSAPPRAYDLPRVSPDGSRIVVWATDQENDLWIWDMARLSLTRLTFAPGVDLFPVWTPDGRRVLFSSSRDGIANLYAQAADGSGTAERLTTSPNPQNSTAVTPDGTKLIFTELAPGTRGDVLQVNLTGGLAVTPLVQTPADERNGVVSPDGRWLAYEADDSGRMEIYVRPYPEVSRGRWQVSSGGGQQPRWSRDGHELFFASPQDALLHIIVENGPSWRAGTPSVVLREGTLFAAAGAGGATYDVSPDGRRFLVVKEAADLSVAPPQIIVVQHFDEVLKGLAPGK
jgi:serine/threonine-protein kinase